MPTSTITCLCSTVNVPLKTPLPGATELCHCDACRYTTGALFVGCCALPNSPDQDTLSKCTAYNSSGTNTRYFCSTCGTKLFVHRHHHTDGAESDHWFAFGGAVDPDPKLGQDNILNIQSHCWIKDTIDGGMAVFMTKLEGSDIPCFSMSEESTSLSSETLQHMSEQTSSHALPSASETLKAQCHCGKASLLIQPANHSDRSISILDRFIAKTPDGEPTNKHMAFCCVCRYCRQGTGVSLTPFAYIPPKQVLNAYTNQPVAQPHEAHLSGGKEANEGLGLKYFWASDRACRGFCGTCGASVLYSTEKRKEILNVAAGLLRADEGVMARKWLSWQWGRTAWKEEATQRDVMMAWRRTGGTID